MSSESLQKLIKEQIALTIYHLKAKFPLSMAELFLAEKLFYYLLIAQFDYTDIATSDASGKMDIAIIAIMDHNEPGPLWP